MYNNVQYSIIKRLTKNSFRIYFFTKMEIRTHFQALDHISLAQIFSYLDTSDVLLNLSLTCKDLHKIISTSPYIIKSLFENLFGRKIIGEANSNLTFPRFQEILKALVLANTLHRPLPFFGFRGNCGCYSNSYNYLFDKVFESRADNSLVCTKYGENFEIEGVLSEDFGREVKCIQNIISAIKQTDQAENHDLYSLKDLLQMYGSQVLDFYTLPQDHLLNEKIKPLRELRQELAGYLKDRNDQYHIELQCQKMMKSVGLIQSCRLIRQVKDVTCPVKTLMAFASLNEEVRLSSLSSLFNDCKTSDNLIQLLKDHKNDLPDISQTSIKKVAELFPHIKYKNEEEDQVEFVVFNSNGKKQDVIPLFWVNFKKAIHKDLSLNFKDCHFSGRYVMLKLIQCEDLREGIFNHEHTNIDMKSCCFYGPVVNL